MYSNQLIVDILNYLDLNINEKLSVNDICTFFNYNKDYIMRLFNKELNMTIVEYINNKRVYNSLQYLKNKNYKILFIALTNGFASQEYYSEIFKKYIGVCPSIYKKSLSIYSNISLDKRAIINNNIINIYTKLENIKKYKNNIKPTSIKVLTIFK